jgi:uncharacterized protein
VAEKLEQCGLHSGMDRREFLRLAMMTSAMLAAGAEAGAESVAQGGMATIMPKYAALTALEPGAVQPEGWLKLYLEKQAAELGSNLDSISWPFSAAYWSGLEEGESWWPWEQKAYWLDGAMRLGLVLNDADLIQHVQKTLRYTIDHADTDGYLGPQFFKGPRPDAGETVATENFHRWPQMLLFRGVTASYEAGYNADAVDALHKHYTNDKIDYGKPIRNVTNIEDMLWVYARTGDEALLARAEKAWADYLTVTKPGADGGDLQPIRVFAATPIDAHGVTYIETAKQPALLYLYTGKQEYLDFAHAAMRRVFDHHMLVDGIPSTSEFYRTRTSLDSHETCDITDHTWSWGYMLMATGDACWADAVEKAAMNAGFGALKKDWKALQYFSCPNQFLSTLDSDHNVMEHGGRKMSFQPNPGERTACCGGDVHRLYPNYVMRMWMKDTKGGLTAAWYGPSRVKAKVGAAGDVVEIEQRTNYPFEDRIEFAISGTKAVEFPLSLRIPSWCAEPKLAINGKAVSMPVVKKGFITLKHAKAGDTVTLTLPMHTKLTHWPQNGVAVEHGPLVYAMDIEAEWTPQVIEKFSTKEFPSWTVQPKGAWNYGLAVDEAQLDEVKVHRKAMTKDPWIDPPVTLTARGRKIDGWELQANPDKPEQKFTPPLPVVEDHQLGGEEELTLVPYGATHLRLTIFPEVKRA